MTVYHMASVASLCAQLGENYLDPTTRDQSLRYFPDAFAQDGFIHATKEPSMLLTIGTHFYRHSVGDWVCLEIQEDLLDCEVKYEARESFLD
jgi:uncharacterized protein (DUF952 family)